MQVLLSIITPGITSLILLLVKSGRLSHLLQELLYSVASLILIVKAGAAASCLGYAGQTLPLLATSILLYSFFSSKN